VQWYPLAGVPFGGDIVVGSSPPNVDTYVASCMVSMPKTVFSEFWACIEQAIPEEIQELEDAYLQYVANPDDGGLFQGLVEEAITQIIYAILFDGFTIGDTVVPGVVNGSIDYVFGKIQTSFEALFSEGMAMISDSIGVFDGMQGYMSFDEGFTESLLSEILSLPGIDEYLSDEGNLTSVLDGMKTYVCTLIKEFLEEGLAAAITLLVDAVMAVIETTGLDEVTTQVLEFLLYRIHVLQARCTLTLWEGVV
jgi:hypothetical protein